MPGHCSHKLVGSLLFWITPHVGVMVVTLRGLVYRDIQGCNICVVRLLLFTFTVNISEPNQLTGRPLSFTSFPLLKAFPQKSHHLASRCLHWFCKDMMLVSFHSWCSFGTAQHNLAQKGRYTLKVLSPPIKPGLYFCVGATLRLHCGALHSLE